MNHLRIIFMGTPEFAVPALEILVKNKFEVVAVVTAPDKPRGRGQLLAGSPVKRCAEALHLPVLQPVNLKSAEFQETLRSYHANLQVVVAFRMLPEIVWAMPSYGTFNLHASLLPNYRGAAPINWAIINGEKETGVTTFFLKQEIDTGSIIYQEKEPIDEEDDAGSLYGRLMHKGARLVLKTVQAIDQGNYPSIAQIENTRTRTAPKIFKETCSIAWNKTVREVRDFVRGLSPYPAAWAVIGSKTLKIFTVASIELQKEATPGEFTTDNKNYIYVRCNDGWIAIGEFQPEGKKRMSVQEYFRGNKL